MEGFCRRMKALIYKEFLQLIRDSSSLLLGIVLPIILILIIGYGISLDVKNVPCAVVLEDASPKAQDAVSFLNGSDLLFTGLCDKHERSGKAASGQGRKCHYRYSSRFHLLPL